MPALRRLIPALFAALALPASAGASVLYVGDSLGVGTAPYLRGELAGTGLELDAEIGRPSSTGVGVLESLIGPQHDVVVFDLGTNDDPAAPDALAANLDAASRIAGDRCLVVATLNRPPVSGVPIDGLNRAVTSFAAGDPSVALVDWHAAAQGDPGLLLDGVHADGEGYALRAGLFAQAIASCASVDGSGAPAPAEELEHEGDSGLPPPASAGRNTGEGTEPERAPRKDPAERDAEVLVVATEVARAIATGADFG